MFLNVLEFDLSTFEDIFEKLAEYEISLLILGPITLGDV